MNAHATPLLAIGAASAQPVLLDWLARAGYMILRAETEAEALKRIATSTPEAVLYGIAMPGPHSVRFVSRLRAKASDACIIVTGPDHGAEHTARLLKAGAFDYVTQPVSRKRLLGSIRQGLEVRRSFIQVRELSATLRATNEALAHERDALRRLNRNLEALNQLNQALAGTLDADEIVYLVHSRLGSVLPHSLLGVMWFRPERVWMHAAGSAGDHNLSGAREHLIREGHRLSRYMDGIGAAPAASAEQTGWTATSAPSEAAARLLPETAEALSIPLVSGGAPLGLLRLEREPGQPFDAQETDMARTLALSLALALRNADSHSQLQNLAMTDGLTGLLNRRAFAHALERLYRESERYGTPVSLIIADIDFFKCANDRYGHIVGDRVLKEVAAQISQSLRAADIAARYGGEEFAILLPRTDVAQASVLAHRIRERVERCVFGAQGSAFRMTMSFGIARAPHPAVTGADDLVARADTALYRAKALGRNRVESYDEPATHGFAGCPPREHTIAAGNPAG